MGQVSSFDQKIVKKSRTWHRHGKHQPIDPLILRQLYPDRKPRDATRWFDNVTDLFSDRKRRA